MKTLLGVVLFLFTLNQMVSAQEISYLNLTKLEQEKKSAIKEENFELANDLKNEIERRQKEDKQRDVLKIQLIKAVDSEQFIVADSLKKELDKLNILFRCRNGYSNTNESQNSIKQIYKDSIDLVLNIKAERKDKSLAYNTLSNKPVQNNTVKTPGDSVAKNSYSEPNLVLNTMFNHFPAHYYGATGISLRFKTNGLYMDLREIRWQLVDRLYAGYYVGAAFLASGDIITSIGLETTYLIDYGARFVPYTSLGGAVTMFTVEEYNSATEEFDTKIKFGFGGHVRGGAFLFFNDQKKTGIFTDVLIGFRGGVDYRFGLIYRVEKK